MKLAFTLILSFFSCMVFAQPNGFVIKGQVQDASTSETIDYATVVAKNKVTGKIVNGTTTSDGGRFLLKTKTQDVSLEVSFIGFEPLLIESFKFDNNTADLGILLLGQDAQSLDEVIITSEKSTTEYKLDKKVFNVGSDLSSSGAGALEVLNNVPSVNVNIEGDVSLRGSTGVQILINGKPSILSDDASNALGTITADMIDKIEVITNPSAKYEAEGTSGIINIILKKEEKKGLNGSISINTGIPQNHSIGLSLNRRTQKFNLFTQLGTGYRELPRWSDNINRNKLTGTTLESDGIGYRNEQFYNLILGSDYYINEWNVITLSGSFAYEIEDQPSETDFQRIFSDSTIQVWNRNETTEATNPKYQYELQYKRDFKDFEDHTLMFSAVGQFFGKDQSSTFNNNTIEGQVEFSDQITETTFQEGKYTFNIDYTKPFNELWTIETGSQYLINDVSNDFKTGDEVNGAIIIDSNFTNVFEYEQRVLGIYGTGAYENESWGIKAGLRMENTDLKTLLVNNNETNKQNFTDLFPTLHTSYKFTKHISAQAGYSKRIFRPRLWDLNPFFNIRNNFSIRVGNPNLLPEYTDSYEIGAVFIFDKLSFNTSIYHRFTSEKIERVLFFEDNVNTTKPENIGTQRATGLEANAKYTLTKKISLNFDGNYNVFVRKGQFNEQNFDFSADQWSSKLMLKYKWSRNIDFEVTGRHQSREKTIQGKMAGFTTMDAGVRIKILKGKGVFNFGARDIFASRIFQNTIDNSENYLLYETFRGRYLTLGFSYGFGKGEAMQFSGRRRY